MVVKKIDKIREVSFRKLEERLREVSLRGFPDVKIYRNSNIEIRNLSPEQIKQEIFIPQPSVYLPQLNNVSQIKELFTKAGVGIFNLNGGWDYEATDENGEVTEWTIIPPVVEVLPIRFNLEKGLDYSFSIGRDLAKLMSEKGYTLNPEVEDLDYLEYKEFKGGTFKVPEVCDGSHRIELAIRNGLHQNILFIENITPGFPYYAAPKPYRTVHEEPERVEEKLDKTHVLTSPGHKLLYRLFPSGGINSGNVRPLKQEFD